MKKIIDYVILDANTTYDLGQQVIKAIQYGWQPIGGICYRPIFSNTDGAIYQTMVRYEQ